jgi:hypothetical protein
MESLDEVFHKERSKENLKIKGLKPLDQRQNAKVPKEGSKHQGQMQMSNSQQTKDLSKHRLSKLRSNAEIDEFLHNLLMEDMINDEYWNFHAKAVHTLGIARCNRLAINARNGYNKQSLYATKIKGALQLHAKQQFES